MYLQMINLNEKRQTVGFAFYLIYRNKYIAFYDLFHLRIVPYLRSSHTMSTKAHDFRM